MYCPSCGKKFPANGSEKTYVYPGAAGVMEKLLLGLCPKCKWSWNIAGAKEENA